MATHQDAMLIIEFSRWAEDWGFHPANRWVRGHLEEVRDFDTFKRLHPPGTDEHRHPFTVLGYFENLGLFHRHGVIDEDLLFDWLNFIEPWELLSGFARSHRDASGNPGLWEHFERLAAEQEKRVLRPRAG